MPLYEYHCGGCQTDVELLIRGDERPTCPSCGGKELEKLLSVPASPNVNQGGLPLADPGNCGRPACDTGG